MTVQERSISEPVRESHKSLTRGVAFRSVAEALRTWRGRIGATLAVAVFLVAFVGPFVPTRYNDTEFVAPAFSPPGTNGALLGTDRLGRDVLARTLHGGSSILLLGLIATVLTIWIGASLGVAAAYRRGLPETVTMRGVDVVLAIPQLVFVLLLLSVAGPVPWLVVVAVTLAQVPQTARVIHGAAQNVCEQDFVKAMAILGMRPRQVLRRHIMPSLVTPLMVESGLRLGNALILITGLSFLGFSTRTPPAPDWGVMVAENRLGITANPWGVLTSAILLAVLSVGINTFADSVARAEFSDVGSDEVMASEGRQS
jgi:peptide/nickel transport system permease protein